MNVFRVDLENRKQVKLFVELPFSIYRHSPNWVPPLLHEAYNLLNPSKNPFFRHSEAAFFMVMSDNFPERAISRVAILNHKPYNNHNQEKRAFFYLFESEDNLPAAQLVFEAAFDWARQQGLEEIYGPKGFSALDSLGLLVKGHEHRAALGIPYHLPYYESLLSGCGFSATSDVLSGYLSGNFKLPEKIHTLAHRIQERRGLHIASLNSRKELYKLLPDLQEMYNGAIKGTPGNSPLNDAEVKTIANQLLWFADLRLIKFILKDHRPIGFLFAYPDISQAIQKCKGRIWPFGWLRILLFSRKTDWLDINGAGIIEEYRGMGGTAILFSELEKSINVNQYKHLEVVQIGADNERMLRELRAINVDFYKTHRLFLRKII